MSRIRSLLLILAALQMASLAQSGAPTDFGGGYFLMGSCQLAVKAMDNPSFRENPLEAYRDGYCRGLVRGISDTSPKVCAPSNATYGQAIRLVAKYLHDNPGVLRGKDWILVEGFLSRAYPCRRR
ncbi:MAG TPA: Rap1a/Tai family immunity protein [Candidatus Sulfotelmatobacter sp.]|jgi:hypothetical protein